MALPACEAESFETVRWICGRLHLVTAILSKFCLNSALILPSFNRVRRPFEKEALLLHIEYWIVALSTLPLGKLESL